MVNHGATLLANIDSNKLSVRFLNERLSTDVGEDLTAADGNFLSSGEILTETAVVQQRSYFTDVTYTAVKLPNSLAAVHDILFPKDSSVYYCNFLLYCYLKIIDVAGFSEDLKKFDNRITYDLANSPGYFNMTRIAAPISSDPQFSINVLGSLKGDIGANYYYNNFVVRQISNTSTVYVFSLSDNLYYKRGQKPSKSSAGMAVTLNTVGNNLNNSDLILVGDTGLMFRIHGPMNSITSGGNRAWSFLAEAPFNFDLPNILGVLRAREHAVRSMLDIERGSCAASYENYWISHFNDVYKLAGLLMAYIERANILWQRRVM